MPLVTEAIPGLGGHLRVTYDCRTVLLDGRVVEPDGNGWWLSHPDSPEECAWYTGFDLRQRTYGHPIGHGGHRFNPNTGFAFTADGVRVPITRVADPDRHRPVSVPGVILHYLNEAEEEVTTSLTISALRAGAGVSAIVPGHYQAPDDDDDDDGEPPNWLRKTLGELWHPPQQPEPPPAPAIASSGRGSIGGGGQRGHMGSSGNGHRGRMGRL